MRRSGRWMGTSMALGLVVMLGGCSWMDSSGVAARDAGGIFGPAWGGSPPTAMLNESLTIARLRGAAPATEPLQPEPGNVWPTEESPRATLANPEAALRGIPAYAPTSPREVPGVTEPLPRTGPTGRLRGSSSPPPPPLLPSEPERANVVPPLPPLPQAPPQRNEGQVVQTPQGPVMTNGGTDRVQTFVTPGGGTGIIQRDNGTTTIIGPNGQVQTIPAQR